MAKKMRTSQQKAQRAQMGVLARFLGSGYLIYLMVQFIQQTLSEEDTTNLTLKLGTAGAFILVALFFIVLIVLEFARGCKTGMYRASSYTDDFLEGAEEAQGEDAPEADTTGDDEPEDESDGKAIEDASGEEDEA